MLFLFFFFSSRRRHTRCLSDWSSDVCSSDLHGLHALGLDERIATVEAKGMEPMVEPTVARWFTPKFIETRKDVIEPVRAMIRHTPPKGYVGCCHAIKSLDLTDRLKAITLRTLIIVRAQAIGTPLAASQAINQQIKGSELVVLDPASHLSNLEQPEAFTGALEAFLKRVA